MASNWVETLRGARKTGLLQDGRKKVHYTFPDGNELVEEYDEKSFELLVRKWRRKTELGGQTTWEMEIGEDKPPIGAGSSELVESSGNPVFFRRDTRRNFQWRIRNMPYAMKTYIVKVEDDAIVVRTTNKKYFKKIEIPDMKRAKLPLNQENLMHTHTNGTLIIQYQKPRQIIDDHMTIISDLKKLKITQEGDADCKQS